MSCHLLWLVAWYKLSFDISCRLIWVVAVRKFWSWRTEPPLILIWFEFLKKLERYHSSIQKLRYLFNSCNRYLFSFHSFTIFFSASFQSTKNFNSPLVVLCLDRCQRLCVQVDELWEATEALQGPIHASGPHAKTHKREASQVHCGWVRQVLPQTWKPQNPHSVSHWRKTLQMFHCRMQQGLQ